MHNLELLKLEIKPNSQFWYTDNNIQNYLAISKGFFILEKGEFIVTKHIFILKNLSNSQVYTYEFSLPIVAFAWSELWNRAVVLYENKRVCTYHLEINVTTKKVIFNEASSNNLDAPVPALESVGWGSKETQFQGKKKLKTSAVTDEDEKVVEDCSKEYIIKCSSNEEYFAVSYWNGQKRKIKSFNFECGALCETDEIFGLLPSFALRSQGNYTTGVIPKRNRHQLVFFERNGRVKDTYDLKIIGGKILELAWSPCSKVLALVHQTPLKKNVCLYTLSNGTLYLKQVLPFKGDTLDFISWEMSVDQIFQLVINTKTNIYVYKFVFKVHTSYDFDLISVIDGTEMYITAVSSGIISPPLYTKKIEVCNPINYIGFHPSRSFCAIIDCNNKIKCFDYETGEFSLFYEKELEILPHALGYNHFIWYAQNLVYNIQKSPTEIYLHEEMISNDITIAFRPLDYEIDHISICNNVIFIQSGTRLMQSSQDSFVEQEVLENIRLVAKEIGNETYLFSLNLNNELLINDQLIHPAEAFLIYGDYLIFSNRNVFSCICIKESDIYKVLQGNFKQFDTRKVHEHISLIGVVPSSGNIILETPRGNLEVDSCRTIDLDILNTMLNESRWSEAISFVRSSKLNWNLLLDLDYERFFNNLNDIIKACNTSNILNAFSVDIEDNNVLQTHYKDSFKGQLDFCKDKKTLFCSKLLAMLEESGHYINHLRTIIVICAKCFGIDKAISYIRRGILTSKNEITDDKEKFAKAISTLRTFFNDQEILKSIILTYDRDLMEFVIPFLQNIDPKELIFHLNKEKNFMSTPYYRFVINNVYKKYDIAVSYLMRSRQTTKEQVLEYIKKTNTSKEAYKQCMLINVSYETEICELFAESLGKQGKNDEAANILTRSKLFDAAIPYYIKAYDWENFMANLVSTSFTDVEKKRFILDMGKGLVSAKKFKDAASFYQHFNEWELAIDAYMAGQCYREAIALCKIRGQSDTLADILDKIDTQLRTITDYANTVQLLIEKYFVRLMKVRLQKAYKFEQKFDAMDDETNSMFDGASTVSFDSRKSGTNSFRSKKSLSSKKSISSVSTASKQIRKQQKRQQNLKEGNYFEDIALVRELHILISTVFKYGPDFSLCASILLQENTCSLDKLSNFQNILLSVQKEIENIYGQIWTEDFQEGSSVLHLVENLQELDEVYRVCPPEVQNVGQKWVLQVLL